MHAIPRRRPLPPMAVTALAADAVDRRCPRRHHGDRRRRDRARRRAEPDRVPAAPARRRDRAERRPGVGVRRVPARRQPQPDAGAGRRRARRVRERGHDVARGDSARPDRADRDPARPRVEPVRRRCDRRRHPGVHAARHGGHHRQSFGRRRHLRHVGHQRRRRRHRRPGALRRAARLRARARGFNAITDPANPLYNPRRATATRTRACRRASA